MTQLLRPYLGLLLCFAVRTASASESIEIEVAAGQHDRENTPVFVSLPPTMRDAPALSLSQIDASADVPVQILRNEEPQAVWILREKLPTGAVRRYRLETTDANHKENPIATCTDNGQQLLLSVAQKPVLTYQHATKEPPEGIESVFRRSGFIHPVFTPSGGIVTDDFPPDHPHQHGIFFAWVNTTIAGRDVNFWDPKAQTGHIRHSAIKELCEGDVFAQFRVELIHSDITNPEQSRPVINETWTVRAFNLDRVFVVDFESVQTSVADSCTINAHNYGGMAFRGLRSWFEDQSFALVTSEGQDQQTGNESRPKWVRMSGPVPSEAGQDDELGTLMALGHPNNFRASQPVRLHPDKPYFCFAPMIAGPFTIAKEKPFVSRYRFLIFDGEVDSEFEQRVWNDYAEPPAVRTLTTDAR
jgi:hypothetical protein